VERFLPSITITQEGRAPSREYPDGLAPARYGLSSENSDCLIAGRPLLDLSNAWAGIIEVKVTTPGVIRGHAAGSVGQSTEWEVILIPDDFTEGWAYLPARWFSESVFGAELLFQAQGAHRPRAYVPHVRMSALDGVGHFEFTDVPAGNYRIGMRSTVTGPALVGWRDMNRVEVPSGGITETVVAIPESSAK
jgi:hypothetical protein